jgi:hypothetical protein
MKNLHLHIIRNIYIEPYPGVNCSCIEYYINSIKCFHCSPDKDDDNGGIMTAKQNIHINWVTLSLWYYSQNNYTFSYFSDSFYHSMSTFKYLQAKKDYIFMTITYIYKHPQRVSYEIRI